MSFATLDAHSRLLEKIVENSTITDIRSGVSTWESVS